MCSGTTRTSLRPGCPCRPAATATDVTARSRGQTEAAAHLLQHVTPQAIAQLPPDYVGAFALDLLAWAAIRTGDGARAGTVTERLRPYAGYAAVWAGAVSFWGPRRTGSAPLAIAREGADVEQARLARIGGQQPTAEILRRPASVLATEIGGHALAAEIARVCPAGR